MHLTAAATVALCASLAAGYGIKKFPTGSSQEKQVCQSLEPGHGLGIQPPSPDYVLSASKSPDGTVKVTLSGAKSFKGFVIQAQGANGAFIDEANFYLMSCSQGATIRHDNKQPKTSVSATFVPSGPGAVTFQGAVVEAYTDYYELPATPVLTL